MQARCMDLIRTKCLAYVLNLTIKGTLVTITSRHPQETRERASLRLSSLEKNNLPTYRKLYGNKKQTYYAPSYEI